MEEIFDRVKYIHISIFGWDDFNFNKLFPISIGPSYTVNNKMYLNFFCFYRACSTSVIFNVLNAVYFSVRFPLSMTCIYVSHDFINTLVISLAIYISSLVGDVLICTAFLSYSGPFNQDFRLLLTKAWSKEMKSRKIPFTANLNIVDLLTDPTTVSWNCWVDPLC